MHLLSRTQTVALRSLCSLWQHGPFANPSLLRTTTLRSFRSSIPLLKRSNVPAIREVADRRKERSEIATSQQQQDAAIDKAQLFEDVNEFHKDFVRDMEWTLNPISEREQVARVPTNLKKFFASRARNLGDYNLLLKVCTLKQRFEDAKLAWQEMRTDGVEPHVSSYVLMIRACGMGKDHKMAFRLLDEMKAKGIERSYAVYGALADTCMRSKQPERAFSVLDLMRSDFLSPNEVVYTALIHGCAKLGLVDRAFATFEEMRLQPIKMDAVVLNLMIHLCGKKKQVERALMFFEEMEQFSMMLTKVTWSCLIDACARRDDYYEKAFELYDRAIANGYKPDQLLFLALLLACSRQGDLQTCYRVLQQMDQFMVPKSKEILNTAIATIAQSQVFLKVSVDGKELSQEDRIALAYDIINEMKSAKMTIEEDTVMTLLSVLTLALRINRAETFVQEMKTNFGIEPGVRAYAHMLKMYARASKPDEAFQMFEKIKEAKAPLRVWMYDRLIRSFGRKRNILKSHQLMDEMEATLDVKPTTALRMSALGGLGTPALETVGLDPAKYAFKPDKRLRFNKSQKRELAIHLFKDHE